MKAFAAAALAAILVLGSVIVLPNCTERVDAGHAGVKVNLYGDQKGVDDIAMVTGRVWYNPMTTQVFEVPTFMQSAIYTRDKREGSPYDESITFQTDDGMEISADVALNFRLDPSKVPDLFRKFRKSPEELKGTYLRVKIREIFMSEAGKYSVERLIKEKPGFLKDVEARAKAELGAEGFLVDTMTLVGSPRYPSSVTRSIEAKIQATQRAEQKERELAQAQADAAKEAAKAKGTADAAIEKARGEAETIRVKAIAQAEAIQKVNRSLTPTYVEYLRATRWDGKYPGVVAGDSAGLLLDARK